MLLLQALLSSSIMFSNFMSIYQRRAEAKEKAEHSNRCHTAACNLHSIECTMSSQEWFSRGPKSAP